MSGDSKSPSFTAAAVAAAATAVTVGTVAGVMYKKIMGYER